MADKKKAAVESAAPPPIRRRPWRPPWPKIEKAYGKGSIMRLGDNADIVVEAIPTGSLSLDLALGIGGVPRGRIIEIYGPESSGKTTLALHIVAEAQKRGGEVAFIDVEHALDPYYARALGVDIDSMLISSPTPASRAWRSARPWCAPAPSTWWWWTPWPPSHPGPRSRATWATPRGPAGPPHEPGPAQAGRLHRQDQLRGHLYQPAPRKGRRDVRQPEVTTGGRALKFYASVRIDVRRIESLKSGSEIIGNRTRAKVVKNKVSPPFKEAEFDIMYGEGISKIGEILDLGAKLDLVQKSGSWFAMGETRLGQGRDAAKQYLKDNPEVCDKLEADIRRNAYKLMSRPGPGRGQGRRPGGGHLRRGLRGCGFVSWPPPSGWGAAGSATWRTEPSSAWGRAR